MVHATSNEISVARESQNGPPKLTVRKLGIISRDYRTKFENGYRDFSSALRGVLELLDGRGCDAAVFSSYSIIARDDFDVRKILESLRQVRAVFLEEFKDGDQRKATRFVVYYRLEGGWHAYELQQKFGSLTGKSADFLKDFVDNEMPRRLLGDCCILLCGESNGVKYSTERKIVEDAFALRASIPQKVKIILNPVHDRMTRFEMNLKRKFLSTEGRWTVSVWNKGKADKRGRTKDGDKPAWAIFHDGTAQEIKPIPNEFGLEVGILDI